MTLISAPRFFLLTAIVIASTVTVAAQSGRRKKGSPPPPAPPVSEPTPAPAQQKSWRVQLLVGVQDPSPFDGVAYYLVDTVLAACIGRLNEPSGVKATVSGRRMSRADAIKTAKAETEQYVVWLQVGDDAADASRQVSNTAGDLYVTYMVLEPGTARVKKSGRVQHSVYKVGNVGVGGPQSTRRSPTYSDYAAKQSGREAAERILAAFGIQPGAPLPR